MIRFLPTSYRRAFYNTVCALGIPPLLFLFHTEIIPRLLVQPQAPFDAESQSEWQFITVVTLTALANAIPYQPLSILLTSSLITPRVYRPLDPENPKPSPLQTCTPISYYITFFYVDYLVRKGFWRELQLEDLPPLPDLYHAHLWRKKWLDSKHKSTIWKLISLTKTPGLW